jgi:hypothetical protein
LGAPQPAATLTCDLGEWSPAAVTYRWYLADPPPPESAPASRLRVGAGIQEALRSALAEDTQPSLTVPGAAVGHLVACEADATLAVAGSDTVSSLSEKAASRPVAIGGPYRNLQPPTISGTLAPGARLECSPGLWEGAPDSFSYVWTSEGRRVGEGAFYRLREADEGAAVACAASAHYGSIMVPSETAVVLARRPVPTLCPRRALALVSGRRSRGATLLFGAAIQSYFGREVTALREGPHGQWRRVADARIGPSGYFELHVRSAASGRYRVAVGGERSSALSVPSLLRIASDRSRPGESVVSLRLSPRAGRDARVKVSRLAACRPGPAVASALLAPGASMGVRLTIPQGAEATVFRASARVGGRSYTVDLVVPAYPRPERGFLY